MKSLRDLQDYEDIDILGYQIGVMLGLIEPQYNFHLDCKHIFWTDHPIGNMIAEFIFELAEQGLLERNPENELQFRWNLNFKGSWEKKNG